jgi:hypothetical protein
MLLNRNAGAAKQQRPSVFRQSLALESATLEDEQQMIDEEYEDFEDGEIDELDEVEPLTDEELEQVVEELLIEAELEGRIPQGTLGLSRNDLMGAGLELGLVVDTNDVGLTLIRDIPLMQQTEAHVTRGLELGYAENFARAFQSGNQRAAGSVLKTAKRVFARGVGRAKTVARGAIADAKQAGKGAVKAVRKNPVLAGGAFYAGMTARHNGLGGTSQRKSNALIANAEKRAGNK